MRNTPPRPRASAPCTRDLSELLPAMLPELAAKLQGRVERA